MVVQCRSCLNTTSSEYTDMESIMIGEQTFLECFNECTRLKANYGDELPGTMCSNCTQDLQVAFNFLQVAREADAVLHGTSTKDVSITDETEIEQLDSTEEEVCVMEELLEDEENEVSHMEIMEVETVEEHIEHTEYLEEKPQLQHLFVECADSAEEANLQIKEEQPITYAEDESDDIYLVEYVEADSQCDESAESPLKFVPSGLKWKCVECKLVLHGEVSYEGHMNMHKGIKPYKCGQCSGAYRCKYALEYHAKLRHQIKTPTQRFNCKLCNRVFRLQSLLQEHQQLEHKTLENCKKCFKTFESPAALEEHKQLVHSTATTMQCPHCLLESLPRAKLIEHFRVEHPLEYRKHFPTKGRPCTQPIKTTQWQCEVCKRYLRSETALVEHRNTHTNDHINECEVCSKRFTYAHTLRVHMRTAHANISDKIVDERTINGNGSVQCEVCKRHLQSKNLEKHLALHERKDREATEENTKFLCSYCQREFKNQKSLNQHEKMHEGESPNVIYVCTECDRHYNTQHLLEQHRKQAHKERDHICPICGNAFKLKNQLVNHMKLHLEKNIQCPHCDKKYARKFDLNVHLRTHTGEMPYACHLCDRRFAIKVRLTYHLQKHYGVKHRCKECGAEFNSKQKLKAHSYKHTGMPYRCELCNNRGFANRDVFKRHLLRLHNTTMTDEALVQMFQRYTGKTTRICQLNGVEHVIVRSGKTMSMSSSPSPTKKHH